MRNKFFALLYLLYLLNLHNLGHCQDSLCLEADGIYSCSSYLSTWLVDTPILNVTHKYHVSSDPAFPIRYRIHTKNTSVLLCAYNYVIGVCSLFGGPYCRSCNNSFSLDGSITTKFYIPNLNSLMNESVLSFEVNNNDEVNIQELQLSECPEFVENAKANRSVDPCGYGCTGQFDCRSNYDNNTEIFEDYQCTADATWTPEPPICVAETTTDNSISITPTFASTQGPQESTTSQATSTTISSSSNTAQGPDCGECDYCCTKQQAAAIAITVIGSLFVAVEIVIAIYSCINKPGVQNAKFLYAAFVVCAVAWIASVIVLFVGDCICMADIAGDCTCTADNCTCVAYIAGATIGGISIAGMAVSIGFLIRAIAAIEPEATSTRGKKMEKSHELSN